MTTSCFLGGGTYQPEPRAGDKDSKLVTKVWESVNAWRWRASPWYRMGVDMGTPGSVIEAGEYACIEDTPSVNQPSEGHYYVCKPGWRISQRRGE